MDFFSCGSACRPRDLATDTVKFDAAAMGAAAPASPALERSLEEHQRPQQDQQGEEERGAEATCRELEAQQKLIGQEYEEQRLLKEQEDESARQEREAHLRREQEEEAEARLRQKDQREREERLRSRSRRTLLRRLRSVQPPRRQPAAPKHCAQSRIASGGQPSQPS
mmetsp:Transcript_28410/g.91459  ORF Transcript_28410/g.91459 Transcript_28410/m.91459 type:complete len:167 (+) Transcript_28410:71-571(+)